MKKLLTVLGLAGAGLILTTSMVNAYRGDVDIKGPNYTPERHEAMMEAFDKGDYDAWKELMADRPMADKINENNFNQFKEMHQLMLDGKRDEAEKMGEEMGLSRGMGFNHERYGRGYGRGLAE